MIGTHQLGDGKGCSELCELRRLQTQRSENKPRAGAFDLMGIEYCDKEQQQHQAIDDKCKDVEELAVGHHNDKSQAQRGADPYYLHSRAGVETKEVGIAIGVTGSANAEPSEDKQPYI